MACRGEEERKSETEAPARAERETGKPRSKRGFLSVGRTIFSNPTWIKQLSVNVAELML